MSYINYDFPHSRNQDSDLREIIEMYFKVRDVPTAFEEFKKNINTTINHEVIEYLDSNINSLVAKFGKEKNIVYIGDSYVQGVGGDGEDIQKFVQKLIGGTYRSFFAGGAGFIRVNINNETFLSCVNNAVNSIADKENITDVVFIGGYNELGVVPTPTVEEFTIAMKKCFDLIRSNFTLATIHLVPMPWINITYNAAHPRIQQRMISAGIANGVHTARYAINWLLEMGGEVQSGDNIHPSSVGYGIIANYVAILLTGDNPSRSGSYITEVFINDRRIEINATLVNDRISFDIVINSGENDIAQGTELFSLPFPNTKGACTLIGTDDVGTITTLLVTFNSKAFVAAHNLPAEKYYRIDCVL